MRKCSIIGCLLLLLLSNCSTATDWGGDTCRRIYTPPVAMLTAVGFGFLGAVVDEDGTVNHILLLLLSVESGRAT